VPYSPFVEVLQWVARISPPETLQAQLARLDGSAELGQLVPEITPHVRKGQPAVSTTAEGHRKSAPPTQTSSSMRADHFAALCSLIGHSRAQ
jgi:hypothetical protein